MAGCCTPFGTATLPNEEFDAVACASVGSSRHEKAWKVALDRFCSRWQIGMYYSGPRALISDYGIMSRDHMMQDCDIELRKAA